MLFLDHLFTPPFKLNLIFDKECKTKLKALSETIAIIVYFEGSNHKFPHREFLQVYRVEVPSEDAIIKIPSINVATPSRFLDWFNYNTYISLPYKNETLYAMTINIVSSRKIIPNNLIVQSQAPTTSGSALALLYKQDTILDMNILTIEQYLRNLP